MLANLVVLLFLYITSSKIYKSQHNFEREKTECYKSEGDDIITVKVTHGFPIGPRYLRMVADWSIQTQDVRNRVNPVTSIYDLIKFEGYCENSFKISTRGIPFTSMHLSVKLFTAYGLNLFSHAEYQINTNFDFTLRQLWDYDHQVGISVKFLTIDRVPFITPSKITELNQIMSLLNAYPTNNEYLCVVTSNMHRFIVRSTFEDGNISRSFISGITTSIKNIKEKKVIEASTLTAFGCNSDEELVTDEVAFFYERHGDVYSLYDKVYVHF